MLCHFSSTSGQQPATCVKGAVQNEIIFARLLKVGNGEYHTERGRGITLFQILNSPKQAALSVGLIELIDTYTFNGWISVFIFLNCIDTNVSQFR